MSIQRKQRSGVVLLIVLSLLVLFVFIGVTFIVLAGVQQDVAKKHAQLEQRDDDPVRLLNHAVMDLVRGTRDTDSALFLHDLLQDLYGTDNYIGYAPQGVRGTVNANGATIDGGGQFVRLTVTMSTIATGTANVNGYYNGCVFTMLTGQAAGMSTRVVQYYPVVGSPTTIVVEMPPEATQEVASNVAAAFSNGTFLINGRPFNGTGAGYDSANDDLNRIVPSVGQAALCPNYGRYVTDAGIPNIRVGSMDESWDAADFQNMFLAYVPLNPFSASQIVPSFHRPSLVQYWASQPSSPAEQFFVLRPDAWSPQFNGSNLAYSDVPAAGTRWDVDNDGDGVTDSIWIDPGYLPKADASGRLYKPLFAYLVVDLDSRVNLNAAGNFIHQNPTHYLAATANPAGIDPTGNAAGVTSGQITVPRGFGVGPGEICLAPIMGNDTITTFLARYGQDFAPGQSGQDPLSYAHDIGVSPNYFGGFFGTYASPPDLRGQAAIFVGPNGQPQFRYAGNANETIDDPYEINLLKPNAYDQAFTPAEMERLLRWYDSDAGSLPTRLLTAGPNTLATSAAIRRMVTTHSFHIPAPNTQLQPGPRSTANSPAAMSIMANRLLTDTVAAVPENQLGPHIAAMLPFELLQNRMMDLNRPFGNGLDDNSNSIIDEFLEPGETHYDYFGTTSTPDYANDDPIQGGYYARQVYARHLYCLMMFLLDKGYAHPPKVEALDAASQQELTARLIAQWAVNCVDFRDADAVMTPFEYDIYPFDGWSVDENIGTNDGAFRGLVWGCEYPDLVLTETLAFHDVRLADTDAGGKRQDESDPMAEDDEDLDSVRIPQGSLYIEVRCNRNRATSNPALPPELYTSGQLDLGRLAPDGSPVWRVVVSPPAQGSSAMQRAAAQPDTTQFDPRDMDRRVATTETMGPSAVESIERVIWFAAVDPTGTPAGYEDRTYYNRTPNNRYLPPGNYAVAGPRATTYIGRQRSLETPPSYRISLNPGGSPQVAGYDSSGATVNNGHTIAGDIQPPLAMICGAIPPTTWADTANTAPTGIGMNVSEPLPQSADYYPEPTILLPGFPTTDSYRDEAANTGGLDDPLDRETGTPIEELNTQLATGTTLDYKSCFLQRLANPLLDYHPTTNPYITIDWSTIDLTVFNGEDEEPAGWAAPFEWNPDDPDPYGAAPDERFGARQRGSAGNPASFWSPFATAPNNSNSSAADLYFNHEIQHTLGYLNTTLGVPTSGGAYLGEPSTAPFPWLTFNNRPFVSPYELLLVPCSEPSRLTMEFSINTGGNPYGLSSNPAEFNHLLNFFSSGTNTGSNFNRILDFVDVPSRFVGTRTQYNPANFADSVGGPVYAGYRTPFNYTSRFRDPGRVNINTIPDDGFAIWRAISRLPQAQSDAQWNAIVASRRGATGLGTRYAGVFQSMVSGDMAPLAGLKRSPVQAGLLREGSVAGTPLLAGTSTNAYENSSQHAYFRYQHLSRTSNMVTTHSNVYAVWITVGFFAVDPMNPSIIRQEIGVDTGDVQRHRGFFLVDRSIPVAYEPGENHNVRKCIVLERFLE